MTVKSVTGRADLVRALAHADTTLLHTMADMLGFNTPIVKRTTSIEETVGGEQTQTTGLNTVPESSTLAPVPFWRAVQYERLATTRTVETSLLPAPIRWEPDLAVHPRYRYLQPWRTVEPRLRALMNKSRMTGNIDVERVVRALSRGSLPRHWPRQAKTGWGLPLQLIEDRSTRLTPYWRDQAMVRSRLAARLPDYEMDNLLLLDGQSEPYRPGDQKQPDGFTSQTAGRVVLVLGDLGCLSSDPRPHRHWLRIGRRLQAEGTVAIALVPCSSQLISAALHRYFMVLPWVNDQRDRRQHSAPLSVQSERLLRLVSPALRIEPGLLRAVRLAAGLDVAVEAIVWQDARVSSRHSVAATLLPHAAARLRHEFDGESEHDRQSALDHLREWRAGLPQEIWFEEIVSLSNVGRSALPIPEEYDLACQYFERLNQLGQGKINGRLSPATKAWFNRAIHRFPDTLWQDSRLGAPLTQLEDTLFRERPEHLPTHTFDPVAIDQDRPTAQPINLFQQANNFELTSEGGELSLPASPLASLASCNSLINVSTVSHRSSTEAAFWHSGRAPTWASDWGEDNYGYWVSFAISKGHTEIEQRLRWIAPGEFMMGSPEDEAGRDDDEGPQHRVTLTQGYWLFDTPCTQGLWEAVMGSNPSEFKSPERPVESVSWEEAQSFISQINRRIPGLELVLPSEAQWEYACRAGSQMATYGGDMEILGERNAPVLDALAWYGGNSGEEFELESGYNSSDWEEKQYDSSPSGTHGVGLKQANAWGLYDMLGNVDEWCSDGMREYTHEPRQDPVGDIEASGSRVVRGGAWHDLARYVRCAYRDALGPDGRDDGLGFRCARVQVGAEHPVEPSFPAERRTTVPLKRIDLRDQWVQHVVIPTNSAEVELLTDTSRLTLRRQPRPHWTDAMGRDQHGLWADISIPDGNQDDVVQRLRWIAPGEFTMGSPKDEVGRDDDEGPQHRVTLTKGYWLFDTPCTQGLWEAVMGSNPSEFKSPERPVESVSWEEVQSFISQINRRIPGLELVLPSEAQWEYACRAGSQMATYGGDMEILGERNAPVLDALAWYGGNSGEEFELESGYNSSDWEEKQYDSSPSGTHGVGLKQANAWGLYDMLGNVDEWCSDGMREYTQDPKHDPVGDAAASGSRVVRGGAWGLHARRVRCAYRDALEPGGRDVNLGFRCARVQE